MKTVDLSDKVKYPRSYRLPFSPGATSDDKKWTNEQAIAYTTGKILDVENHINVDDPHKQYIQVSEAVSTFQPLKIYQTVS